MDCDAGGGGAALKPLKPVPAAGGNGAEPLTQLVAGPAETKQQAVLRASGSAFTAWGAKNPPTCNPCKGSASHVGSPLRDQAGLAQLQQHLSSTKPIDSNANSIAGALHQLSHAAEVLEQASNSHRSGGSSPKAPSPPCAAPEPQQQQPRVTAPTAFGALTGQQLQELVGQQKFREEMNAMMEGMEEADRDDDGDASEGSGDVSSSAEDMLEVTVVSETEKGVQVGCCAIWLVLLIVMGGLSPVALGVYFLFGRHSSCCAF